MRFPPPGIVLLCLSFSAGSALAADAGDWLVKMGTAARQSNYEGVLVYRGEDILETFRVTHRFANGSERERVQSLTGEVREVLQQNDQLTCILPEDGALTRNRPTPQTLFPSMRPEDVATLEQVYAFKELGDARVAGRNSRGIFISPRDAFRYGYEIWGDVETALPLKVSLVAAEGQVLEQMFFTEVEFPQQTPDSAFSSELNAEDVQHASATAASAIADAHEREPVLEQAQSEASKVTDLPPGYRLVKRQVRKLPGDRGAVEHLVFSDGLTAVSVFRSASPPVAVPEDNAQQRVNQIAAINAYSRRSGHIRITVVGEAPKRTVRMIGDNFARQPLLEETSSPH